MSLTSAILRFIILLLHTYILGTATVALLTGRFPSEETVHLPRSRNKGTLH